MAVREAKIKMLLDAADALRTFDDVANRAKKSGRESESALKRSFGNAFGSAKNAANDLFSSMKGAIGQLATLGGAASFGLGVKQAIEAEESYIRLAGAISNFSGKMITAEQAQKKVTQAADAANVSLADAAHIAERMSGTTGPDELADAVARVASQSRRLGTDADRIVDVYTQLQARMGMTGEEAELVTEQFARLGRSVLGLNVEDTFSQGDISDFVTFASQARIEMDQVFKLVKQAGPEFSRDMGQASELFEEFADVLKDTQSLQNLSKKLRIDPEDLNTSKSSLENLFTIMEKGGDKGAKMLIEGFGNPRTKRAFRNILGEALVLDIETGRKGAGEKVRARAAELREQLATQTDMAEEAARIEAEKAQLQDTSAAKLRRSLREVEKAFQQPAMVEAIGKVADLLPTFAKRITGFIDFVAERPAGAAAALVLSKVGLAFTGSLAQEAAAAGVKKLWNMITETSQQAGSVGGLGGASAGGKLAAGAGVLGSAVAGAGLGYAIGQATGIHTGGASNIDAIEAARHAAGMADITSRGGKTDPGMIKRRLEEIKRARKGLTGGGIMDKLERGAGDVVSFLSGDSTAKDRAKVLDELAQKEEKLKQALDSLTRSVNGAAQAATARLPSKPAPAAPGSPDKAG